MGCVHLVLILLCLAAFANIVMAAKAYYLFLELIDKIQGREEKTKGSDEGGGEEDKTEG